MAGRRRRVKVSAAWLIERAGFHKGYSGAFEGVAVSAKHTLALTNRGTGTTAALLGLAREIRDGVAKAFDVTLEPEPVLVNCLDRSYEHPVHLVLGGLGQRPDHQPVDVDVMRAGSRTQATQSAMSSATSGSATPA